MNTSKVTVKGNEDGTVISISKNNPEWGSIRVKQTIAEMQNGFVKTKDRYAYVRGTVQMLSALDWSVGQQLDGKIVIRESLTPFNPDNASLDYKIAGTSGVVCRYNGAPIYRKAFFETNPTKFNDELIAHNNTEEIRIANEIASKANVDTDLSL
jgi:hypothetical protein